MKKVGPTIFIDQPLHETTINHTGFGVIDTTNMGGHSAWKKRVARGELAKGSGGAILRHRPRLGRRGKDLELNRKGKIGGGNPKKVRKQQQQRALLLRQQKERREAEFKRISQKQEPVDSQPISAEAVSQKDSAVAMMEE